MYQDSLGTDASGVIMEGINIKGIQKTSLIDYPGKMCSVVFLSKCNFRCPFCHNPELVFDDKHVPDIDVSEFLEFLDEHKKWIDAVCITGGEPTLHFGLIDFMKLIKAKGLYVKLDTNGTNPEIIRKALSEKCVDYIAMDVKNSLGKYESTTKSKVNTGKIAESIKLLIDSEKVGLIEAEFRSTILPKLHSIKDIEEMAELVKGAKKYTLQQFKSEDALVDMTFRDEKAYTLQEMEPFKNILEKSCETVDLR